MSGCCKLDLRYIFQRLGIQDADQSGLTHPAMQNDVVLRHIFSFLDLKGLKNVRLVCKSWSMLSKAMMFEKSVVLQNTSSDALEKYNDFSVAHKFHHNKFFLAGAFSCEDAKIVNFFQIQGKYINGLYISFDSKRRSLKITPLANLCKMFNLIFEKATNIKELHIYWKFDLYSPENSLQALETTLLEPNLQGELKQLRKFTFFSNEYSKNDNQILDKAMVKYEISQIIVSVLEKAKKLKSFKTTDHFVLFLQANTLLKQNILISSLSTLVLQLKDDVNQPVGIELLVLMGKRGLALKTFHIEYYETNSKHLFADFAMLIQFLISQKDSLTKLNIKRWQKFYGDQIDFNNPLKSNTLYDFPKMNNLQNLTISFALEDKNETVRFSDKNWLEKFPNLSSIEYTFIRIADIGDKRDFFVEFLGEIPLPHKNVKLIRVNAQDYRLHDDLGSLGIPYCSKLYNASKKYFPNLDRVILNDWLMMELISYSGSRSTSTFVIYGHPTNPERLRYPIDERQRAKIRRNELNYFFKWMPFPPHADLSAETFRHLDLSY